MKQLYIKDAKGRYCPLYQRIFNGEYAPIGIHIDADTLTGDSQVVAKRSGMEAMIRRTNNGSLQNYIDKGLKVDGTSKDWRSATKEVESIQDLVDIIEQTDNPIVVSVGNGKLQVEIYDDYREG